MPRSRRRNTPLPVVRITFRESLHFSGNRDGDGIAIPKDTVLLGSPLGMADDGEQDFVIGDSLWTIDLALVDTRSVKQGEPTTIRDLADETLAAARAAAASQKWDEAVALYHQATTQLAVIDAPADEREHIRIETVRARNKRAAERARDRDLDERQSRLTTADLARIGAAVVLLTEAMGGFFYEIPTVEEGNLLWRLIRHSIQTQTSAAAMRPALRQIFAEKGLDSAPSGADPLWPPTKEQRRRILADLADSLTYVEPTTPAVEREASALLALQLNPDELDAYNILADLAEERGDLTEAVRLSQQAVERYEPAVQQLLAQHKNRQEESDPPTSWLALGNRPYLRALQRVGLYLHRAGKPDEAVPVFEKMLDLNPSDNQGIRYVLANALLELGDDDRFERLQQRMWLPGHYHNAEWASLRSKQETSEEARLQWEAYRKFKRTRKPPTGPVLDLDIPGYNEAAGWKYPVALHRFRVEGDGPAARAALQRALVANRHVATFLTGRMALPPHDPQHYSHGSVEEAINYVREGRAAWQRTPGALEWLATQVSPPRRSRGRPRTDGVEPAAAPTDPMLAAMPGLFPRALEWQREDAEVTHDVFDSVHQFIFWVDGRLGGGQVSLKTTPSDLTPELIQAFVTDPPQRLNLARGRAAIGRWLAWLYQQGHTDQDLSLLLTR